MSAGEAGMSKLFFLFTYVVYTIGYSDEISTYIKSTFTVLDVCNCCGDLTVIPRCGCFTLHLSQETHSWYILNFDSDFSCPICGYVSNVFLQYMFLANYNFSCLVVIDSKILKWIISFETHSFGWR